MNRFAILNESVFGASTVKNWVKLCPPNSSMMTSANRPAPDDFYYASREDAEAHAQDFRAQDARRVESGKRRRKNKPVPETFTVVEVAA